MQSFQTPFVTRTQRVISDSQKQNSTQRQHHDRTHNSSPRIFYCFTWQQLLNLTALISISSLTSPTKAAPVVTTGAQLCNAVWFHGYQSLGITYTVGDSNTDSFVIGGSVPSGCALLDPSQTYLNDKCAVIQYFGTYTQAQPSQSFILSYFPYSATVKLGITGILALAKSKDAGVDSFFGVVQIGSGPTSSSSPASYTPDGTELAIFGLFSTGTDLRYYQLAGYFKGFNCKVNKKTIDGFNGASALTIAFQDCNSLDNYVVQINLSSNTLISLTKFPKSQLLQWYTVSNDGSDNSAFLTGMAAPGPALTWLVTKSATSSTAVSSPKCKFDLHFDSTWISKVTTKDLFPAFAAWASDSSSGNEGVVALHNPSNFNGFVLILTWDQICQSNFDVIWGQTSSSAEVVTVRDMQLYYDSSAEGTGVKLLIGVNSAVYLITGIVNNRYSGWHSNSNSPTVRQLIISSNSLNPLFQFSLSDVDLSAVFMFKDKTSLPVFFGQASKYWQGVSDGFMWRDTPNSCLNFQLSIPAPFGNNQDQICFFSPSSPTDHYFGSMQPTCVVTKASLTISVAGVSAPTTLTKTSSSPPQWTSTLSYSVKNPCMMSISATTVSPQLIQLGSPAFTVQLTPSFQHNCPYSAQAIFATKLDYKLISVVNTATSVPSALVAAYTAPSLVSMPYTYFYQLLLINDIALIGSYTATFQFTVQGDANSVVFSSTTTYQTAIINVRSCSPSASFPPTLSPLSVNIGTPYTYNMFALFQNGDCAYSTVQDTSSPWYIVSTYTKELQVLQGVDKVQSTTTDPILDIYTTDQSQVGVHVYNFKYTDYKGTVYIIPRTFTFVQTSCVSGVTGLSLSLGPFYQSIMNTTALSIDVSTVQNNNCGYTFTLQQQSGPQVSNFMTLNQPTFTILSVQSKSVSTYGSLSVNALTGTIPLKQAYVGMYTFQLLVKDELTPFTTRGTTTFQVQICDCVNEWNPSVNLTRVDYILSSSRDVEIPSFVDTTLITCNSVVLTFTTVSGVDLTSAITILQTSTILGTAKLTISTSDSSLRNTLTLVITCTDTGGGSLNFYLPLTIKHMCDDSVISSFTNFDQTVTLNGQSQFVQIPLFTQTTSQCDQFVYNVTYQLLSGPITMNLLALDVTSLLLTIIEPTDNLSGPSVVKVTVGGQILGIAYLPSEESSFKLTIVPMVVVVATNFSTQATNSSNVNNTSNVQVQTVSNKTAPNFTVPINTPRASAQADKTPLIPNILSISSSGLVKIKFNRNIVIPSMYSNVSMRRNETDYVETIDQFLVLKVKSGIDNLNPNRTRIVQFNLTDFQKTYILMQVDFLNPQDLSPSYSSPDTLHVQFKEAYIFVSETQIFLANDTEIRKPIPTQLSQIQALQVAQLTSTVSSGMNTIATINLIVNIVLSFGLKYLWNFVNLLQFLVFIPRWKINIPLNALAVLQQLKSIALMEFIPTKQITGTISGWFAMDPNDDSNIMNSMGLMLLIALVIAILVAALGIASYFVNKNYSTYKTYRGIRESIFYNAFLRYMLQSVLKVGLASATTLSAISWSNFKASSGVSVLTSSLILLVMGLGPFLFALILKKNFNRLQRPSTRKTIGSLYLSIKDNDKAALAYSSVFMLRRLLFIAITFGMVDQPGLQIHFFSFLNLFYIMYLGIVLPHDISQMTSSELVNESILMLTCYHFILFTGVVDDLQTRTNIGWSLAAFIGLLLIFNVSVILMANISHLRRKYTLWKLRRNARNAMEAKIGSFFAKNQSLISQPSPVQQVNLAQQRNRLHQAFPENLQARKQDFNPKSAQSNQFKLEDFSFRGTTQQVTAPTNDNIPLKVRTPMKAFQVTGQVRPAPQVSIPQNNLNQIRSQPRLQFSNELILRPNNGYQSELQQDQAGRTRMIGQNAASQLAMNTQNNRLLTRNQAPRAYSQNSQQQFSQAPRFPGPDNQYQLENQATRAYSQNNQQPINQAARFPDPDNQYQLGNQATRAYNQNNQQLISQAPRVSNLLNNGLTAEQNRQRIHEQQQFKIVMAQREAQIERIQNQIMESRRATNLF